MMLKTEAMFKNAKDKIEGRNETMVLNTKKNGTNTWTGTEGLQS